MPSPGTTAIRRPTLARERRHQPARGEGGQHEAYEQDCAEAKPAPRLLPQQHGKDRGHQRRVDHEVQEVALDHAFRPRATSIASSVTRTFSSPAVAVNVTP